MASHTATIDTSVLISLQCAGLLHAIPVVLDRVLVPRKVCEELKNREDQNHGALRALDDFAFFENCDEYNVASVEFLLQNREQLRKERDQGEAEAVVQAAQKGVTMVLTDDSLGRKWAAAHSVEPHGTLWICRELRYRGFLTELRPYFVRMVRAGRRLPLAVMNEFLEEFVELTISLDEFLTYTKKC